MSPAAITPDTVVETISDIRTARIPIIPAVDSTTMTCLSPLPSIVHVGAATDSGRRRMLFFPCYFSRRFGECCQKILDDDFDAQKVEQPCRPSRAQRQSDSLRCEA